MDVFRLRRRLVDDYGSYVSSFIRIKDERVAEEVLSSLGEGLLWPDPLIHLNPSFEAGETIDELVPEEDESQDTLFERPAPKSLSLEDAALALHACVPDGEKVDRHTLLLDAARELGQTQLTRKVRRTLNQALNAEHNAGRLRTDWQLVWKTRK